MRTIIAAVLLLVAACAGAGEVPDRVEAAVELANSHSLRGPSYVSTKLQPYFFEKVVSHCVGGAKESGQPFVFAIAIERTGRVVKTHAKPETDFTKCLAQAARRVQLPPPPFASFLADFDLRHQR